MKNLILTGILVFGIVQIYAQEPLKMDSTAVKTDTTFVLKDTSRVEIEVIIEESHTIHTDSDTIPDNQVIIDEEYDEEEGELLESGIVKEEEGRTRHKLNMDYGLANYLQNGKFPDSNNEPYTLKPWGSWYMALSSVQSTKIAGPLFLEWGLGASWYNLKLQDPRVRILKGTDNIEFVQDVNNYTDYKKSRLMVTYLNAFMVPVFKFGKKEDKDKRFRIGAGGYAGYRLYSSTKFVYVTEKKQKDKANGNFHLNNLRYGVRAQIGWKGTDLYFNYDMNDLFVAGQGPQLNNFSFGVIF